MQVDDTNSEFRTAVNIVNHTNRHLFLTGRAGTGKTTFLKYICNHTFKKLAVVAPTGVAAINAGGVTIHSFFQLPFGTFLANKTSGWNDTNDRFYNANQLLGKLRIHKNKRTLIRELDLLIIDEISMVRADILDAIDTILRHIRRRHHEPFGGVQMIYIGDLFQLPPVVKDNEWLELKAYYEGPFFFQARVIQEISPIYLELKKIYRQDNPDFISLLNNIRNNCCSSDELELLEQYYQPDFIPDEDDGYITLTSHNYLAKRINERELFKLYGTKHEIKAKVAGEFPDSAFPTDGILEIKEGAQIMFIKNDKGEDRRYFNGKTGIIEEIDNVNETLLIRFPEEQDLLELKKETWRNIRFQYDGEKDEIKEKEIGTFKQFPLRLAWAVTIHKSQGLTFKKAVIDAGQAFAAGQVYVALSRLTDIEGLILRSRITPASIQTNEQVKAFADSKLSDDELDKILEEAQQQFLHRSLLDAFRWDKLLNAPEKYLEGSKSTRPELLETGLINELKRVLLEQQHIGRKFIPRLENLLQTSNYSRLHERILSSAEWFTKELDNKIIAKINRHIDVLKIKPRTKKKVNSLQSLLQVFENKKEQLKQAVTITNTLLQSKNQETLMKAAAAMYHPKKIVLPDQSEEPKESSKPAKGESMRTSLSLFREGKSIEEIAQIRELKENTILGHLVTFIPTQEVKADELFDTETLEELSRVLKKYPEAPGSKIREITANKFSYPEIKAAMALKT